MDEDPGYLFERAVAVYVASILFVVIGFVSGWTLRGQQDAPVISSMRESQAKLQEENRLCASTLEESWKQGRAIAASAARCREVMSKRFAIDLK